LAFCSHCRSRSRRCTRIPRSWLCARWVILRLCSPCIGHYHSRCYSFSSRNDWIRDWLMMGQIENIGID
jgi:hypothetical protein